FEATALGTTQLAALQVVQTLFFALALALDALAIAGQALIALRLGADDVPGVQTLTARLVRWAVGFGVVCAVLVAAGAAWIPYAFTAEPAVRSLITTMLFVLAAGLPLAGAVFVLDGVLMGAEDARYLALAQVASLLVFAVVLIGLMSV